MGDVLAFPPPSGTNQACSACGSQWFSVKAVTLAAEDGRVVGYAAPVSCHECGEEVEVRLG